MMKRKLISIILISLLMLVSCTNNSKTVKTFKEAKQLADEFYKDLQAADNIKMTSYSEGKPLVEFVKDGDKMYTEYLDPEYGYGYYVFIKDGIKYLLTDDGTLFEDESMYDFTAETLNNTLMMNVMAYLDFEDVEGVNISASEKAGKELSINISGKAEDTDFNVTSVGTKEDGKVTNIKSEIKSGESNIVSEYQFSYDEHVEIPEYTEPKNYNNLPHVDSPYKTFGEIIDDLDQDERLFYSFINDELLVIADKDDRYYQFSRKCDEDIITAYGNLDFEDENYDNNAYDLIRDLEIEDCVDFTDELISEEVLNSYEGKHISDLINDGFEITGYSFYEDHNHIFADKDMMTYDVDVKLPADFNTDADFDYDDFNDFEIDDVEFDSPEYAILPMR